MARAVNSPIRLWGPARVRPRHTRELISTREVATKWSWKIGQFAGIGVYLRATFLLLVGWVAVSHRVQARSLEGLTDHE